MKKLLVLMMVLFAPSVSSAAQQTWVDGDSLSSIRTKIQANDTELYGRLDQDVKTTSNPSFLSVHASDGNLAANNAQVTKKWLTALPYVADVTSVIHGGHHFICTSSHTAGSTTEPGVGASWATVWAYAGAALYEPLRGTDDNYVTDAEKIVIGNTSGTNTGDQTIPTVSDTAYDATSWNGNNDAATKNAIRDKIETIAGGTMTYPGAGIPLSTGSAWGTSYSLTTLAAALDGEAWTFTGAVDMSGASSVSMGPIYFEGSSVDANDTCFSVTNPTGSRTVTILDTNSTIPAASSVDASGKILSARLADTPSANGISLYTAANYAAMRTLLDLEVGTDYNAYDADLTTWAGVTPGTGVGTMLANAPGAEGGPTTTIEFGTSTLGTSAINSGECATAVDTAATNAATTDVINWGFNGDPTGVTGYAPTANGMLTIISYPSAGYVHFKVCNLTAASITPGAITLNWRIQR